MVTLASSCGLFPNRLSQYSLHKKCLLLMPMSLSYNPNRRTSAGLSPSAAASGTDKRSRSDDDASAPPVSPDESVKRPKDDDARPMEAEETAPAPPGPVGKCLVGLFGRVKDAATAAGTQKSTSFAETTKQAPIFAKPRKVKALVPEHVVYIWTTAIASASSPPAKAMAACVKTVFSSIQAAGKQKKGRVLRPLPSCNQGKGD